MAFTLHLLACNTRAAEQSAAALQCWRTNDLRHLGELDLVKHCRTHLAAGEVTSVEALAGHIKRERRHVGRTLALAFLSPEITKAILSGEQPSGLRLSPLPDADLPLSWNKQREMLKRLLGR